MSTIPTPEDYTVDHTTIPAWTPAQARDRARDRSNRPKTNHPKNSPAGIKEDIVLECLAGIMMHLERRDWSQKWAMHYTQPAYRDDQRAQEAATASKDAYRRIVDAVMAIGREVSNDPYVFADVARRQQAQKARPLRETVHRTINKALL